MNKVLISILIFMVMVASGRAQEISNSWTILYYAAGCNSSEETLLGDLAEIQDGMTDHQGYRVVVLIDRIEGFSTDSKTFGEDFTDTRLYEITAGGYKRLSGKEFFPEITTDSFHDINMGDAHVLKQFIGYGKKYFPARHYALFMYSHGDGVSFCGDNESNRDALYPAELTDVLTERESVDLMALDVCSMGGIELAYQWRPQKNKFGAGYMVASAPVSAPWDYTSIFSRLKKQSGASEELDDLFGGNEHFINPSEMTPLDFGKLLIEEIFDNQPWCSWGFFDLKHSARVKEALDAFIGKGDLTSVRKALLTAQETTIHYIPSIDPSNLAYYRMRVPYFDLFDLLREARKDLKKDDLIRVDKILDAVDDLVVQSFYAKGGNFLKPTVNFDSTKNGIYIFFPFGKEIYTYTGGPHWQEQRFYTPDSHNTVDSYGNLAWCADGATPGNGKVENWFELLDFIFDDHDINQGGGYNYYKY